MKILIVEDNPRVRRLIRRSLADVASEVRECEDGAGALAAYEEHLPDLVLMDVRMPRMDGLSATRQLLERHPGATVVILTDYDDDETRQAAAEAGARAYAQKHNLTELEGIVNEAFTGGRELGREAPH